MPASGPQITEKCLDSMLTSQDADLVLVEYAQNTVGLADELAFERLLRHLLRARSAPAVVLLHLPSRAQVQTGALAASEEARLAPLAEHYRLPSIRCVL